MICQDPHSIACSIAKRYGGYKLALCRSIIYILSPTKRATGTAVTLLGNTPAQFQATTWAARNATVDSPPGQQKSETSLGARQVASFAKVLTPRVATVLLQKGALVPRYLCQLAIKDVGQVPPALFSVCNCVLFLSGWFKLD
jgi:hypothetical protein